MQNAQNEIMVFVIRQLQIPFHETAILTIYISPQKFGKQTCEHCYSLEVSRFCEFWKIALQLKWISLIHAKSAIFRFPKPNHKKADFYLNDILERKIFVTWLLFWLLCLILNFQN